MAPFGQIELGYLFHTLSSLRHWLALWSNAGKPTFDTRLTVWFLLKNFFKGIEGLVLASRFFAIEAPQHVDRFDEPFDDAFRLMGQTGLCHQPWSEKDTARIQQAAETALVKVWFGRLQCLSDIERRLALSLAVQTVADRKIKRLVMPAFYITVSCTVYIVVVVLLY